MITRWSMGLPMPLWLSPLEDEHLHGQWESSMVKLDPDLPLYHCHYNGHLLHSHSVSFCWESSSCMRGTRANGLWRTSLTQSIPRRRTGRLSLRSLRAPGLKCWQRLTACFTRMPIQSPQWGMTLVPSGTLTQPSCLHSEMGTSNDWLKD